MPTKYSGRILVILFVALACLFAIFPKALTQPGDFFDFSGRVPFSQKLNLRPGIDMVGGTSLLYEIKPPDDSTYTSKLAERVMISLKKRVDPQGVRNLVWRPQGDTRLEIQMPMSAGSEKAEAVRESKIKAADELEATNVNPGEVVAAVEDKYDKPKERATRLKELAKGSPDRQNLFDRLAQTWDDLQAAKA